MSVIYWAIKSINIKDTRPDKIYLEAYVKDYNKL